MSESRCEQLREVLPDLADGRLDPAAEARVRAHVEGCPACADELALVELLLRARPQAPAGLGARIRAALAGVEEHRADPARLPPETGRARSSHPSFPWWGLAAAAVAAVALGIGIQLPSGTPAEESGGVPAFALEGEADELWLSGDGEIAGAPTLDDVSDEALLLFLEELDEGGSA